MSRLATARHSKDIDVFLTATEAAVDDTVDGFDLVAGARDLCRGSLRVVTWRAAPVVARLEWAADGGGR
jgi:hypothetical protein